MKIKNRLKSRKRKCALLLVLVMMGTLLCAGSVCAEEGYIHSKNTISVDTIKAGDRIWNTWVEAPVNYTLYYRLDTSQGNRWNPGQRMHFDHVQIISCEKDEQKQCYKLVYEEKKEKRLMVSHKATWVLPGEQVTLTATIPEEYKDAYIGFQGWATYEDPTKWDGWRGKDLGLTKDELSQMTITFTMPNEDFWIDYSYIIDTVSGNGWRYGYFPVDTSYLKPGDKPDENIVDIIVNPSSGETDSSAEGIGQEVPNVVQTADGKTWTPSVDVVYVAASIGGAMPTGTKETVQNAAGLTPGDIQNGKTAKFYIGDVYKTGVKASLQNRVHRLKDVNMISMIDMDLYTIGKDGIHAVRHPSEPVEMILTIPAGQAAEGRSYSMVCIINGETVEVKDKDDNPNTITIDAAYFGPYALIWR